MKQYARIYKNDTILGNLLSVKDFNEYINNLMFVFKNQNKDWSLNNFIKFYNEYFWVSGSMTTHQLSTYYEYEELEKKNLISLIEIFKIDDNNNCYYHILNPEIIYINYKNDNDFFKTHSFSSAYDTNQALNVVKYGFSYRRIHYPNENRRIWKERLPSKKHSSYRQSLLDTDRRYHKSLNQPVKRKNLNFYSPFLDYDEIMRSEKENWKNTSKNRHQWEHNLGHSSNVSKYSKQDLINNFYDSYNEQDE